MATMQELKDRAAQIHVNVRGVICRDTTREKNVLLEYDIGNYACFFSSGYFQTEQDAINFMYVALPDTEEDLMNLLKNDKLFPNIRGVMLKDKPVVLTLSGKVQITELQGGDARVELFFSDHRKTAVVNPNQALNIIEMYGPDTSAWKGKRVTLFAEEGTWFGKHQWGIRVSNQIPKNGKKVVTKAMDTEVEPFEKDLDKLVDGVPTEAEAVPFDLDVEDTTYSE